MPYRTPAPDPLPDPPDRQVVVIVVLPGAVPPLHFVGVTHHEFRQGPDGTYTVAVETEDDEYVKVRGATAVIFRRRAHEPTEEADRP